MRELLWRRQRAGLGVFVVAFCAACGGGAGSVERDAGTIRDTVEDVVAVADSAGDLRADTSDGGKEDAREPGLPSSLPFSLSRQADGVPVPADELAEFSARLATFLRSVRYFDYVLRSSHGVAASTGRRPYVLWWSDVEAVKAGDTVTFRHKDLHDHGGHNIMTANAHIIGPAIAAWLMSADPTVGLLVERYCQGISATMLGMVHDTDDPLPHLMARNIITFNHDYTTHDGREKAVDYSSWFSSYERWNCMRFLYPDNPYWGPVWVTNGRSKDDVGHLFRVAGWIEYAAARGSSAEVREACAETMTYLTAFAADIVDSGYYIRTKDEEGAPYIFSQTPVPGVERRSFDLDNFVTFDPLLPTAECNAKSASDWLGYDRPGPTDCGDGGPNVWERTSLLNNYPNIGFLRGYHLANQLQALIHGDAVMARQLTEGLVRRNEEDMDYDWSDVPVSGDRWYADLALSLVQASAQGYPLTNREVRLIHTYFRRALDRFERWPYWDLWADSVPDGVYDYAPPARESDGDGELLYNIRVEDIAALLEYCWSPFRNPQGAEPVDCSILGDPATWLPEPETRD